MKRQSTRRNVFSAFVLFALAVCTIALATPITARDDTAGNEFSTQSVSKKVTGDLYWAGETLDLTDNTIGQDVIAAGQDISLSDSSIGGSAPPLVPQALRAPKSQAMSLPQHSISQPTRKPMPMASTLSRRTSNLADTPKRQLLPATRLP